MIGPGGGLTEKAVNGRLFEVCPATVTFTFEVPTGTPFGTGTVIDVEDHEVGVPSIPPKVTVLVPGVVPRAVPEIVTAWPTEPLEGFSRVIAGVTVNAWLFEVFPPTVRFTFTFPAVVIVLGTAHTTARGDQLETAAGNPPMLQVLDPWVARVPVVVSETEVPMGPFVGDIAEIFGTTA